MVTPVDDAARDATRVTTTDSIGCFRLDSLAGDRYDIQVMHPAAPQLLVKRVTVDGSGTGDVVVPASVEPSWWFTFACLVLYLATIVLVRWHNIAKSIEKMLVGQLLALSTRLKTEVDTADKQSAEKIETLKKRVEDLEGGFSKWSGSSHSMPRLARASEFLFWSRGRENAAGWRSTKSSGSSRPSWPLRSTWIPISVGWTRSYA